MRDEDGLSEEASQDVADLLAWVLRGERVAKQTEPEPRTSPSGERPCCIPVLCCSAHKIADTFYYDGKPVKFVAAPEKAPRDGNLYCRPDDRVPGANKTWRDVVREQRHDGLIPAYQLYQRDIYREMYAAFQDRFYILSGGWGLIRANYKLPAYDITFSTSPQVAAWVRRGAGERWNDFNHLQDDAAGFPPEARIFLFAGKDYVDPFCRMTQGIRNRKVIAYASSYIERRAGFEYERYPSGTNWFYEAVKEFKESL
jgi:hypothetical protein